MRQVGPSGSPNPLGDVDKWAEGWTGLWRPAGSVAPIFRTGPDDAVDPHQIMDAKEVSLALSRMAAEIYEAVQPISDLLILGIPTRGVYLANRISAALAMMEPDFDTARQTGQLDITMYRDDLRHNLTRTLGVTKIPGGVDDRIVLLVDDVLFSGRTIRAALEAISDQGRPRAVRLATLIDRGHRELPIRPDFVGRDVSIPREQRVWVQLAETDRHDAVWAGG